MFKELIKIVSLLDLKSLFEVVPARPFDVEQYMVNIWPNQVINKLLSQLPAVLLLNFIYL